MFSSKENRRCSQFYTGTKKKVDCRKVCSDRIRIGKYTIKSFVLLSIVEDKTCVFNLLSVSRSMLDTFPPKNFNVGLFYFQISAVQKHEKRVMFKLEGISDKDQLQNWGFQRKSQITHLCY